MNSSEPTLNRQYDGEAITLRAARRDVIDFLTECGANAETVERASLITSELASNAIQAGPGTPYHLGLRVVDPNAAALSVRNHTDGGVPPPQANWRPIDEKSIRGRGLSIVDSLADEVTVEVEGAEVVVTAWFRLITT